VSFLSFVPLYDVKRDIHHVVGQAREENPLPRNRDTGGWDMRPNNFTRGEAYDGLFALGQIVPRRQNLDRQHVSLDSGRSELDLARGNRPHVRDECDGPDQCRDSHYVNDPSLRRRVHE
jgi:hypothetical protein